MTYYEKSESGRQWSPSILDNKPHQTAALLSTRYGQPFLFTEYWSGTYNYRRRTVVRQNSVFTINRSICLWLPHNS